jgi:hypothetical protein
MSVTKLLKKCLRKTHIYRVMRLIRIVCDSGVGPALSAAEYGGKSTEALRGATLRPQAAVGHGDDR